MTSTLVGPVTSRAVRSDELPAPSRPTLTGLDLLAGGSLLVLALVAWASLALAHLGAHSLPAVAAVSAVALVVVLVLLRRFAPPVRLRADLAGVGVALGCALLAGALTWPGFSYGVADKDPGGYVSHAIEISRTGSYSFIDPLVATKAKDPTFPEQEYTPGARFPGVWVDNYATGKIVPQFYHLWPALLATAYDAGGLLGLRTMTPLIGALSILLLCAVLRRVGDALVGDRVGDALVGDRVGDALVGDGVGDALSRDRVGNTRARNRVGDTLAAGRVGASRLGSRAGLAAAGAGGLLLATNMLQVWQARYPTTEILAQALFLGSLLGVVVALQTGWRPAAGLAGLFVGVGWLNRGDGLLLVLLSVGVGAVLLATRRWDGRATWFAAGLAVVTPHALLQAYVLARHYSQVNGIPGPTKLGAVVGVVAVAAVLLRLFARRPLDWAQQGLQRRRPQVVVGSIVLVVATGLLVLGFLRSTLFGPDYFVYNVAGRIRSYDELILPRLEWFLSYPAFVLMLVGLAVVVLRRWSAPLWAVVLPTLAVFPVYGYTASNSSRLMWWARRYIPTVLPGIVILVALALAWFFVHRYRGRLLTAVPAVAALVGLVAFFLSQSLPLRQHDEWRGSFQISQRLADLSGNEQGVYVWEFDQGCCAGPTRLFATPLWLQHGELSVLLPDKVSQAADDTLRRRVIERFRERFPGQPIFIVADDGQLPSGIAPDSVTVADRIQTQLPIWRESDETRPEDNRQIPVDISVWRLRGT